MRARHTLPLVVRPTCTAVGEFGLSIDDVHEERALLRSLLISDYAEFKATVLGDMLGVPPADKSWDDLIEEHLRRKYGAGYERPEPM
jgi:hypothetical protein